MGRCFFTFFLSFEEISDIQGSEQIYQVLRETKGSYWSLWFMEINGESQVEVSKSRKHLQNAIIGTYIMWIMQQQ